MSDQDVIASLALELDAQPLVDPAAAGEKALDGIGEAAERSQAKVDKAARQMGGALQDAQEKARQAATATEQGAREAEASERTRAEARLARARGAQEVLRKAAADQAQTVREIAAMEAAEGQKSIEGVRAKLERQKALYREAASSIREEQIRGYVTPEQAAKMGEAAARAYNTAVLRLIDQGSGAGGGGGRPSGAPPGGVFPTGSPFGPGGPNIFLGAKGKELYSDLASSLKSIEPAGALAAKGVGRVGSALASMAVQEAGARAGLGSLVYGLGLMGPGALVTTGLIAGGALIVFAINAIGKEAREARKQLKELTDELDRGAKAFAAKSNPQAEAERQLKALAAHVAQLNAERRRILAGTILETAEGPVNLGTNLAKLKEVNTELQKSEERVRHVGVNLAEALKPSIEAQRQAAAERRRDLEILAAAERDLALAKAGSVEEELAAKAAIRAAENAAQVASTTALNTTEKARLKMLLDQADAIREQDRLTKEQQANAYGHLRVIVEQDARYVALLAREEKRLALAKELKRVTGEIQLDPKAFAGSIPLTVVGLSGNTGPYDPNAAAAARAIAEAKQQYEAALRSAQDAFQRAFAGIFTDGLRGFKQFFQSVVGLAAQAAAAVAATFTVKLLGIDTLLKNITEGKTKFELGKGFSGRGSFFGNAAVGLGAGALGGSLGTQLGGSAFGGAAIGALSGAAAGSVAGPVGAIVGGLIGGVTGLLGAAAKAREAAFKMAEARKAFANAMEDFVAIAHPRGLLGDAIRNLTRQAQELQKAAFESVGGQEKARQQVLGRGDVTKLSQAQIQAALDAKNLAIAHGSGGRAARDYLVQLLALRKAYDENVEAVRIQIAEQRRLDAASRTVREFRATGRGDDADLLAFTNAQADALAELTKAWGREIGAVRDAALAHESYVQGLEREAFIKQQAINATNKAASDQIRQLGLEEREAKQRKDVPGAIRANAAAQLAEVNRQLAVGEITREFADRLSAVIGGEMADALAEAAAQAEEAARALREFNRAAQEDAQLRILAAQATVSGNQADQERYEDNRRRAEQDAELERLQRDGATEATLAAIRLAQAWEDQAVAAERLRATEEQLRRARELSASANEESRVRELRAAGQDAAAEDLARRQRNQREIAELEAGGADAAAIAYRRKVQQDEIARADAERRAAQQAAFDQAFPTTTAGAIEASATSVNLAVGLSESTASRITGLLGSQLAYQSSMASNLTELVRIARLARGGAPPSDADEELSFAAADGDRAAGFPVRNR